MRVLYYCTCILTLRVVFVMYSESVRRGQLIEVRTSEQDNHKRLSTNHHLPALCAGLTVQYTGPERGWGRGCGGGGGIG